MAQTIRDLLLQAKDKRGVTSGRALADLTDGRENSIDRTQVNALLKGTYKSEMRPRTVRAIAWLAGVDEAVAFAAAEIPVPGPPFAHEIPDSADYLGPTSRRAVIDIIRALVRAEAEGGEEHEGRSAPIDPDDNGGGSVIQLPPPPSNVPSGDAVDDDDVEVDDIPQGQPDEGQRAARGKKPAAE